MTVSIYRSTDNSAPILTGQAGKLIDVLDACLVNGYPTAPVTSLTQTGTTVTAVLPTLNISLKNNQRVVIAGASPAGANGTFAITVVNASTFTYQAAPGLGAITGTITYNRAPVGWTKPFSGTNLAVYRQPVGSNGFYLQVDDAGTTTARATAYELMTSATAGEAPMPTPVQLAGGGYVFKSTVADATARPWVLLSNEKIFYLLIAADSAAFYPTFGMLGFGDFISYKDPDPYSTILYCSSSATNNLANSALGYRMWIGSGTCGGQWYARSVTAVGGAILGAKISNAAVAPWVVNDSGGWSYIYAPGSERTATNQATTAAWWHPYPASANGALFVDKFYLTEFTSSWQLRGELPGILNPMHLKPLTHGDQWVGSGPSVNKTFEAWQYTIATTGTAAQGMLVLEISDTW